MKKYSFLLGGKTYLREAENTAQLVEFIQSLVELSKKPPPVVEAAAEDIEEYAIKEVAIDEV